MASNGATFKPASTARSRVNVNKAAGSKFISRFNTGDVAEEFPGTSKSVGVSIVPKGIPNEDTEDLMCVICKSAVKGLFTVTCT